MSNDYLWRIRCSESGNFVGDCGCFHCFDEFELDIDDFNYNWSDDSSEFEDEEEWVDFE